MIGPSNPVISIGPIVSMPAVREAIAASAAPVVAVSPYVAGQVVKGPTDLFMRAVGRPSTAAGAASLYEGLLDGMICDPEDPDPPPEAIRVMSCPTLMEGRAGGASWPSEPSSSPRRLPSTAEITAELGMSRALPGSLTIRGGESNNLHTTAIVPVKGLSVANGRLDGTLSEDERNQLAEALFLDLIVKLPRSRCIDDVLIVTADASIARQARWFGHKVLIQEARRGPFRGRGRRSACRTWPRAPSASRCCPSTARCSTPRSSTPTSDAPPGPS